MNQNDTALSQGGGEQKILVRVTKEDQGTEVDIKNVVLYLRSSKGKSQEEVKDDSDNDRIMLDMQVIDQRTLQTDIEGEIAQNKELCIEYTSSEEGKQPILSPWNIDITSIQQDQPSKFSLFDSLQVTITVQRLIAQMVKHYRIDFSATNLPLNKSESFFGSLISSTSKHSTFELVSPVTNSIIYESELSKIASTDPFWTLTPPIAHQDLYPTFRVNIFQSTGDDKQQNRVPIASVDIDLDDVISQKETMFEVPGSQHTMVMIDRIQEVCVNKLI